VPLINLGGINMNLPNKLTLLRIILIPVFLLIFAFNLGTINILNTKLPTANFLATIVFIFASLTDWLDGYLARKWHLVTNFGKFADPLADKMLVMTAFIVLVSLDKVPAWVASIIVMRELAVTGLRLILIEHGEVLGADWPGKVKTATQMLSIIFLLLNNLSWTVIYFPMAQILLYLSLIFTVYSGVDYFWKNRQVFFLEES
jgi:CDP-diacylglycerol--glycerol-3-phosphate 3-phosphatidyltransferase